MFNYQKFYEQYACAEDDKKEQLLEQLKVTLYFNYSVFFKADTDSAADFFCEFFPIIPDVIRRYNPDKAGFFSFLYIVIRQKFFNFKNKSKEKYKLQTVIENEETHSNLHAYETKQDCYAFSEPNIDYAGDNVKKLNRVIEQSYKGTRKSTLENKLLEKLLICRAANLLGESKVIKLCELFEIDKDEMLNHLGRVNSKNEIKHEQKKSLERRVGSLYFKMKLHQNELKKHQDENLRENYKYILEKYQNKQRAWNANTERLCAYSTLPTYTNICDVLKVNRNAVSRKLRTFNKCYQKIYENECCE